MNSNGKLICIEGIDGTGKSTLIKHIKDMLPDNIYTQQPSPNFFTSISETIKGVELQELLDKDRRECIYGANGTKSLTDCGYTAIVDRYLISGIVYEYFELSDNFTLEELYEKYKAEFSDSFPDTIIYLDIDPDKAIERIISRAKETGQPISRYEASESLTKLRDIYKEVLDLVEKNKDSKVFRVDASKSEFEIVEHVFKILLVD